MRHGKKINHLSRKSAHRKALMANLASSLILHKRITTTVAKAKALRKYVEPLITKAKNDTTHSRRIVFSYLKHKDPVKELFDQVAVKVAERLGGYTRIIKTGYRLGDNAETCIIELVDYNELYVKEDKKKATRRRTRRGPAKTAATETTPVEKAPVETKSEELPQEPQVEPVAGESSEEPAAESETTGQEETKE